jgi:hypothetical protein
VTPTAAGWQISTEQVILVGLVAGVVGALVVVIFGLMAAAAWGDRERDAWGAFDDDDERPRLPAEFDWDAFDREREDRLGS